MFMTWILTMVSMDLKLDWDYQVEMLSKCYGDTFENEEVIEFYAN